MKQLVRWISGALLLLAVNVAFAQRAALPEGVSLRLHYPPLAKLPPEGAAELHALALALLESSNFNSRAPLWEWDLEQVLESYREAAAGKFLLLKWPKPVTVRTTGGPVEVKEVLIGLNRAGYAGSLHTIDGEGRIVGHSKWSGPKAVELLARVEKFAAKR
jgi:hypothetical protein